MFSPALRSAVTSTEMACSHETMVATDLALTKAVPSLSTEAASVALVGLASRVKVLRKKRRSLLPGALPPLACQIHSGVWAVTD